MRCLTAAMARPTRPPLGFSPPTACMGLVPTDTVLGHWGSACPACKLPSGQGLLAGLATLIGTASKLSRLTISMVNVALCTARVVMNYAERQEWQVGAKGYPRGGRHVGAKGYPRPSNAVPAMYCMHANVPTLRKYLFVTPSRRGRLVWDGVGWSVAVMAW